MGVVSHCCHALLLNLNQFKKNTSVYTKIHQPCKHHTGLTDITVGDNTPGITEGRMAEGGGEILNKRVKGGVGFVKTQSPE